MTLNKITNSGLLINRPLPNAPGQYGTYFFATDAARYYYSDGEKWVEKNIDATYASPETEAVVVCGVGVDNAINPVRTDTEGNLMVSGSPKGALFISRGGITAVPAASKLVVGENQDRQYFFFSNPSDADMYISIGTAASTSSILVGKGGGGIAWENFVPTNAIYVYCAALTAKNYVAYEV